MSGKIVRSGYDRLRSSRGDDALQPVIEVEGKLRFELPGVPLFPSLAADTILKPELNWRISADQPAKLEAQIAYITQKLTWKADYNVVADESTDILNLVGWVTIENKSGKKFQDTQTKLVAGDLNKIEPTKQTPSEATTERVIVTGSYIPVTEKSFDEYHLYSLPHPLTLRDQETKQIEFVRAEGIQSSRIYIYNSHGYGYEDLVPAPEVPQLDTGEAVWEKRIAVVREFKNSEANHVGMPLPKGRWRFYRADSDGQLEFTGENETGHTPKDETIRIFTGYVFDVVAEKRRVDFTSDSQKRIADESFEIKLRNHKKDPIEVRVVENLWRWTTWEIAQKSDAFTKKGAQTIEFRVPLNPDQEKTITYKVHYSQLRPPKPQTPSTR